MRRLLLCLLLTGCAQTAQKYSVDRGPLLNSYEAVALVNEWGHRHNIKLSQIVDYRSEREAIYLTYTTTDGKILHFKVHRKPKKVELLKPSPVVTTQH